MLPRCSPRGNPACRGTLGGRRKAVRYRFRLQGRTADFPCDVYKCTSATTCAALPQVPLLLPSSRVAPALPQRPLAWEHSQRRVTAEWPLHPPAQPLLTGVTNPRAGSPGCPQRRHQDCGGCVLASTRHAGLPADVEGALGLSPSMVSH